MKIAYTFANTDATAPTLFEPVQLTVVVEGTYAEAMKVLGSAREIYAKVQEESDGWDLDEYLRGLQ